MVINRGKRSKTTNEVQAIENINKNPQSFLKINSLQKEVPPLHKLQGHAYKQRDPFELKEDNSSERNC